MRLQAAITVIPNKMISLRQAVAVGLAAVVVFLAAHSSHAATGANVNESLATLTVYVDGSRAGTDNPGNGSVDSPLVTIDRAADYAKSVRNTSGQGVKILIAPGEYRESVLLADSSHATNPIVFEAMQPGTVLIKGSDVVNNWTLDPSTGSYSTPWTKNWGVQPDTSPDSVRFDPIGRRREMVHVNGQRLQQVLTLGELAPGTFYAEDNASDGKLYVKPSAGVNLTNSMVEVATRSDVFDVRRSSNVVLRGLTFQHAASPTNSSAASFVRVENLLLEDLNASENGQTGIGGGSTTNITFNRIVLENNGLAGLGQSRSINSVWKNVEARGNNWRGFDGNLTGWFPAGMKMLFLEDAEFTDILTEGNLTHGFWIDTNSNNVTIDRLTSQNNLERGVYLEKLEGPVTLKNSLIRDNGEYGILVAVSNDQTITNNIVYGNGEGQIAFNARNTETVEDFQSGEPVPVGLSDLVVRDNIFAATELNQLVSRFLVTSNADRRDELFGELTASLVDFNEYWHPSGIRSVFPGQIGGWQTWSGYRGQFGLDSNSTFNVGNYVFVEPLPIPEPGSAALLTGLGLCGFLMRRRSIPFIHKGMA